jgi:hypothetical protein
MIDSNCSGKEERLRKTVIKTGFLLLNLGLLLILSFSEVKAAQGPNRASWQAAYWNNKRLSGEPVLERREANVDYNWGDGTPAPEIRANDFSARWTRTLTVQPATYRFTASSDDGMRVWVDGQLLIDEWYDHSLKTVSADLQLEAGAHRIQVDYYENSGGAVAQLSWTPLPSSGTASWRGEYFNNEDLAGEPRLVRNDTQINFNWGTASPVPGVINSDHFSVRWSQRLNFPTGLYRFVMTVDDGGRLWVNDQLLMDGWRRQSPTTYQADIYLAGGPVLVQMDYFDDEAGAIAQLGWSLVTEVAGAWRGEYFNNPNLAGQPVFTQIDPEINFDWDVGAPVSGAVQLPPDNFSIRWQRSFNLPADLYCFALIVDDGGRVWVNGRLVIEAWQVQASQVRAAKVGLPGGVTSLRMDYFESTGLAKAQLGWLKFDPNNLNDPGRLEEEGLASLPDDPAVVQSMINACKNQPILSPSSR